MMPFFGPLKIPPNPQSADGIAAGIVPLPRPLH
jgi:hypothetical protein